MHLKSGFLLRLLQNVDGHVGWKKYLTDFLKVSKLSF